jgi:hypothetical protein
LSSKSLSLMLSYSSVFMVTSNLLMVCSWWWGRSPGLIRLLRTLMRG